MENWSFGLITEGVFGLRATVEDAVRLLHGIGVRDVEIPSWHLLKDMAELPRAEEISGRLRGLRSLLNDLNMNVLQFHGPCGGPDLVSDSEASRKRNVDSFKRHIDIALALGARSLIVHIGGRHELCREKGDAAIFEDNVKSLTALAEHVGNSDLTLAVENLMARENRMGNRISDLKGLIAAVGSGRIGICLDTGHANVEGLDVPTAVRDCGSLLTATHIQETCRDNDLHLFPFSLSPAKTGGMDWFKIFSAFRENGYGKSLIGECSCKASVPDDLVAAYLKAQKAVIESAMRGKAGR